MEQFYTKKLELARKELELARKELELARKELELARKELELARKELELELKEKKVQLDTDSSKNHDTPQLIKDLYDIFYAEPPLSDEEKTRRVKILTKLNKRRTEERDGATVGRL